VLLPSLLAWISKCREARRRSAFGAQQVPVTSWRPRSQFRPPTGRPWPICCFRRRPICSGTRPL